MTINLTEEKMNHVKWLKKEIEKTFGKKVAIYEEFEKKEIGYFTEGFKCICKDCVGKHEFTDVEVWEKDRIGEDDGPCDRCGAKLEPDETGFCYYIINECRPICPDCLGKHEMPYSSIEECDCREEGMYCYRCGAKLE